jgi:type II secretory pathway component PulF
MAVFEYSAKSADSLEDKAQGTIIARDKLDAFDKLMRLHYTNIKLKPLRGIQAFFKQWSADVN